MPPVLSVDRTAPAHRRGEIEQKLIEAVRRRDSRSTARLIEQWVHRRDLGSLERFCGGPLSASLGREAGVWLEHVITAPRQSLQAEPRGALHAAAPLDQAGGAGSQAPGGIGAEVIEMAAPAVRASVAGSEAAGTGLPPQPETLPQPAHPLPAAPGVPAPCDPGPSGSLDVAAVARDAVPSSEVSAPEDCVSDPSSGSAVLQEFAPAEVARPESAPADPTFVSALPLSGAVPADPGVRAAWSDQPLAAVQADFPPSVDGPEALSPSPLSAGPVEPPSAPRRRFGLASLGRVRALMRECVEEAIGTLQSRSVSLDDDEEDEAGETGAGSALDASARVANSPGWSLQATAPEPDQTDLPPQASWTRSRAAAISAGLAGAPSASSGPPAPAPAALADLRSWLPSAGDNGRRAS